MTFLPARLRVPLFALLLLGALLVPAGHALAASSHHARHHRAAACRTHTHARRHRVCRRMHVTSTVTQGPVARIAVAATQAPKVAIVSAPAASTSATTATFSWQTSGTVRAAFCSVDGARGRLCTSGVSYSGLATGASSFRVRVYGDDAVASATTAWTITTVPSTRSSTGGPITNSFGASEIGIAAGGAIQSDDPATLTQDLNLDQTAGAKWIRVDINWAQIQAAGPSSYNWTSVDAVVTGAEARGMNVLGTIVYTPGWARPANAQATYAPNPAQYAAFAQTAVAHYSALGVQDYEIWNEPNSIGMWTPSPNPAAYTSILKAAYPAIKAVDPTATVITGGLSPAATDGTNYLPTDFLADMYADGAKGSFDAVGMHPYCNPDLPGATDAWSAWYQMYGTPVSIRSLMVANGDGNLKIWGTEFGAPSAGASGVSPAFQAQTVTLAYQLWSTYSWAGPLFFYQGRDIGTDTTNEYDNYGFATQSFGLKPAYSAYQAAAAAL